MVEQIAEALQHDRAHAGPPRARLTSRTTMTAALLGVVEHLSGATAMEADQVGRELRGEIRWDFLLARLAEAGGYAIHLFAPGDQPVEQFDAAIEALAKCRGIIEFDASVAVGDAQHIGNSKPRCPDGDDRLFSANCVNPQMRFRCPWKAAQ